MAAKRVLFVLHNHPAVQPGGTEAYTQNVYEALQRSPGWEPMLVARAGPEAAAELGLRPGQHVGTVEGDANQAIVRVDDEEFDKFLMTARDKRVYTERFAEVLRAQRPDVIHVQHTLFVGTELFGLARRLLPDVPIVHTLHEYLPICNHYGQLVRTFSGELCLQASPRRCNQCYPEIPPQAFFLRQRLIQSQFSEVDMFIAPSRFLLERYVDWGIPRDRILLEHHGFPPAERVEAPGRDPRNRFAFFGVMTPFKGIDVLLRAMERLGPGFDGHVSVHGANYSEQPPDMQETLDRLFEATSATVTWAGPYDHDRDLARLMSEIDWVLVPSVWWENSPLVIQEAYQHGRPVICSDIGGMAEQVRHGVDGLHFRVGDPASLAETIERAAMTPRLWYRLRDGISPVRPIDEHVATLTRLYGELIERRAAGVVGRAARRPMVIGERFAWAHLPKTGGMATERMFRLFPEMIVFADPADTDEKHATFRARRRMLDGKLLAMNLRRLPFWVLSRAQYVSREGIWPDYDPIPMAPAAELAESSFPDSRIHLYTDDGRFTIERWLRTESLGEDFLRFAAEFTGVSDEQRDAVLGLGQVNTQEYDHRLEEWFTVDQVRRMYERNPAWAAIEEELYGGLVELG